MTEDNQPPVFWKTEDGRYKVDFQNIRSPWIKLGLAFAVIGGVLALAVGFPTGPELPDELVTGLIPYVGGAVIIVIALAMILTRLGNKRD
ncbi:MAG: hypothetical protein ACPGNV_06880 [Mangrovicoccus sp.]